LTNERLKILQSNTKSPTEPIASAKATTMGPDPSTKPDYENIVGPLGRAVDKLFLEVFKHQLCQQVGYESTAEGYQGIIETTQFLNKQSSDRDTIHTKAQATLQSLFPSWLPGAYAALFSKPFPEFSARMNAWATWWAGTWLMGECDINDVEFDDGHVGERQGLLVKRCRFLEEAGCASVCVNSCKIPTQNFFAQDMGLPLTMEPNYETFECQFNFGKEPTVETELAAASVPCLQRCPTAGALRNQHSQPSDQCSLLESQ